MTWQAEVRWNGGFRSEAKVRNFGRAKSDEPDQLGGTKTGPNAVEQVPGALGNCPAVGYAGNATAAGITVNEVVSDVLGDLDLHTVLGLRVGNAGFGGIEVAVNIDGDASPEALPSLHAKFTGPS